MIIAKQMNQHLTDEQKEILFGKGTEMPFTGKYLKHEESGMYTCANCGAELFNSETKFESTTPGLAGWPGFSNVANNNAVKLTEDRSYGMRRVEVSCANCGAHLGHVFNNTDDSPKSSVHFCINSSCLCFEPKGAKAKK